jgi:hypothetical protein
MSGEELYNIEKILDRRKVNGKFEYKIKWEGYPMSQSTWEPMKNLETAKELVEEYNNSHPILTQPKSKTKSVKKDNTFIHKKKDRENDVKIENEEKYKEIPQNEKMPENGANNIIDDLKPNIIENGYEKTYTIDDSLKTVVTVKQQNQKLMAVVDKMENNGEMTKTYIPTEELRRTNPWILLDFYESKIKFT